MSKLTTVACVALLLVAACTAPRNTGAGAANSLCPMGGEPVLSDVATTMWRGQAIGFCCKRCQPMFESLRQEEKAEALEAVGLHVTG